MTGREYLCPSMVPFLIYVAIFRANATSVPLFARYFPGGIFRFGHLYTIFGYDVYIGEVLLFDFYIQ